MVNGWTWTWTWNWQTERWHWYGCREATVLGYGHVLDSRSKILGLQWIIYTCTRCYLLGESWDAEVCQEHLHTRISTLIGWIKSRWKLMTSYGYPKPNDRTMSDFNFDQKYCQPATLNVVPPNEQQNFEWASCSRVAPWVTMHFPLLWCHYDIIRGTTN